MHKEFFHKGFLIPEKQQAAEISFLEYLHEHAKLCDVQDALAVLPEYDSSVIDVIKTYVPFVFGVELILDLAKCFEQWLATATDTTVAQLLTYWAAHLIISVVFGLFVMFVLKTFFFWLFSTAGISKRKFILNTLQTWEEQNGTTCIGLANGKYINLQNNIYKLFDDKSDRTFDYKNAYLIDVKDGNVIFHYCLFSNKSYNITKSAILRRFTMLSATHHDWSRHTPHLFTITQISV